MWCLLFLLNDSWLVSGWGWMNQSRELNPSLTFRFGTGTWSQKCLWFWASLKFVHGRGTHAWSDRSISAWRFLPDTCRCTSSRTCPTKDKDQLWGTAGLWRFLSFYELHAVMAWDHTALGVSEAPDLCLPSFSEFSSTAWSYLVLMSSKQPLSPKAPHSMLTHIRPSVPGTVSMFFISSM